jgi:uncharacterized protein
MFAKFWSPGAVKTRLAASLGPKRAAAVHRLFVETLIARFGQCGDQRVIVFTPPDRQAAFRDVAAEHWQLMLQTYGDLGQRMRAFFEESLATCERVVLIGSDSPDLPFEHVEQAFAALESHDVVLGPAQDGGYYLIGARRAVPQIFADIAWGTDRVWMQTIERLHETSSGWHELPIWFDVDDEAALQALLGRIGNTQDRQLHRFQARLEALLSGTTRV